MGRRENVTDYRIAQAITALGRVHLDGPRLSRIMRELHTPLSHLYDARSNITGRDLAEDLAKILAIDEEALFLFLAVVGFTIKDRLINGKPSGIPGLGTLYVRTKKTRRWSRKVALRVLRSLEISVQQGAPFTESLKAQVARLKERHNVRPEKEEDSAVG